MNPIYSFRTSINIGKAGEKLIYEYLKNNPDVLGIEDVSDNKNWQAKDVDFLVTYKDLGQFPIEIKNDQYASGNFFFETMSSIEAKTPGCLVKSSAKFLYYYFQRYRTLYIINLSAFRQWFYENKNKFNRKEVKNYRKNGGTYTTEGYTIPIRVFEAEFKKYRKIQLP